MAGSDFEINAIYSTQIDKNIQAGQKPNEHVLIMAEIYWLSTSNIFSNSNIYRIIKKLNEVVIF